MKTNATVLNICLFFGMVISSGVCMKTVTDGKETQRKNDTAAVQIMRHIKAMEAANAGFVEMYRRMEKDLNDCGCKNCIRLRLNKIQEIK